VLWGWAGLETNDAARRASTRIVLDGDLGAREADDLLEHCRRRSPAEATRIVVDVSAVRACDADGLGALLALYSGDAGPGVVIDGARWSQFFGLLVDSPLEDVGRVRQQVRQLVWDARRNRRSVGADR
jgi:ABC-type transporter Mla MlaB component